MKKVLIILLVIISHCYASGKVDFVLGAAIKKNNIELIETLLQSGSSPNSYGEIIKRNFPYENYTKSQLQLALETGRLEILDLLYRYSANFNIKSHMAIKNSGSRNVHPLQYTASKGKLNLTRYLLQYGSEPNSYSQNYASALTIAAFYDHFDIVKMLTLYNANPDIHGELSKFNGWIKRTPLLAAIENQNFEIIEYILKIAKADICYSSGFFKLYAYRFARKTRNQDIINLVREYHAEDCIWNNSSVFTKNVGAY